MADYYPVLAQAVSRLEDNTSQARLQIYERVRTALAAHLRGEESKRSETEVMDELVSLEKAILRVEMESSQPSRAAQTFQSQPPQPQATHQQAASGDAPKTVGHARGEEPAESAAAASGRKSLTLPAPAEPANIEADAPYAQRSTEMEAMSGSLAVMLFGIAAIVASLAIIAVVYVRSVISAEPVGTPLLLAAFAILLAGAIAMVLMMFRKARMISAIDGLLKATLRRGQMRF